MGSLIYAPMTVGWIATRLILAVALIAAAIPLAAANALAHAGHHHGPSAAKPEAVSSKVAVQPQRDSSAPQPVAIVDGLAGAYFIARSASESASEDGKNICLGGCCTAASSSCCALSLSDVPGLDPPWPGKRALIVEEVGGAGVDPGVLPEPPKSLA
jgi:hypothetical protein